MKNPSERMLREQEVAIASEGRTLRGTLVVPVGAGAVVAFAHGSGSGRFSPRNRFVAQALQDAGLATLLLDLLEDEEADDRQKVFDVHLLADRLASASGWLAEASETRGLKLGYFGASTGAAAALIDAARNPVAVHALVSRGGRPDLADAELPSVEAPTLLIVGGADEVVLDLNRQAFDRLQCPRQLDIVPGATHLFEEPGALDEVARLAMQWFTHYLRK